MHDCSGRNIRGGETDRHVVLEYWLAPCNLSSRNLVAGRHLALADDILPIVAGARKTSAQCQILAGNQDVIVLMQAQSGAYSRFSV